MNQTKSNSFGVRLSKGQSMLTYINSFADFRPPKLADTPPEVEALLNSMVNNNATEAARLEVYRAATYARVLAFRKGKGNIDSLCTAIRQAVIAQFGPNSAELRSLSSIMRRIRSSSVAKAATAEPEAAADPEAKSRSHSERSYAALTQLFNTLVSTLGQFVAYDPAIPALKLDALQAVALNLTSLNDAVAKSVKDLKEIRETRDRLYADLKERTQRITAYVKARYGSTSKEAQLLISL